MIKAPKRQGRSAASRGAAASLSKSDLADLRRMVKKVGRDGVIAEIDRLQARPEDAPALGAPPYSQDDYGLVWESVEVGRRKYGYTLEAALKWLAARMAARKRLGLDVWTPAAGTLRKQYYKYDNYIKMQGLFDFVSANVDRFILRQEAGEYGEYPDLDPFPGRHPRRRR